MGLSRGARGFLFDAYWKAEGLWSRGLFICTRIYLNNRILVQDRGGAKFQTGGILLYVEDLKLGTNKDIGPKDIFEMGSTKNKEVLNHD